MIRVAAVAILFLMPHGIESTNECIARVPTRARLQNAKVTIDRRITAAYETDETRVATLTENDYFGRPIASVSTDGIRSETSYDAWDQVLETRAFEKKDGTTRKLMGHGRSSWTTEGRLTVTASQIDAESGRSRATLFSWQQGDAITARLSGEAVFTDSSLVGTTPVRAEQTTRDVAGRVTSVITGEAASDGTIDPAHTFSEMHVTHFYGELPIEKELREPRAARKTTTQIDYDGVGRPVTIHEGGDTYRTEALYDEAGNQTFAKAPGIKGQTQMEYDSRGLMYRETLPGGKTIQRVYDELGNVRQYIDEEHHATFYDTDGLGRVTAVHYPDHTSEETRYEQATGVVTAHRDRSGLWTWYKYDNHGGRLLEERLGGKGTDPDLNGKTFVQYTYDNGGRVARVASEDAAIEYDDYDLLGRPKTTRTIRYKKTGCIPAIVSCGAGLTDPSAIAEVYTQGHEWSVFDERTRWRMPVVGSSLPASESGSSWRHWIDEQRDAASNLVRQQEALGRNGTASGTLLTQSTSRGEGRLAERTRGALTTRFGYADTQDNLVTASVPVAPVAPGAPTGGLGRSDSVVNGRTVAGTEVTLGSKKLIETAKELGLTSRE